MRQHKQRFPVGVVYALICMVWGGCTSGLTLFEAPSQDSDALDGMFVAVERHVSDEDASARDDQLASMNARHHDHGSDDEDFYLAVHRDALDQTWFMSTYLKQFYPAGPAPSTLGTRVVELKVQNGKLYVFDVDGRRQTSDQFDPELIVEAYPIVDTWQFRSFSRFSDYIFIDPAAGLNRFDAVNTLYTYSPYPEYPPDNNPVETSLSFVKAFNEFDDGVSYEQIFIGYAEEPIEHGPQGDQVSENDFLIAGTLGISWREYTEGENYTQLDAPDVDHYFLSRPHVVTNSPEVKKYAAHWDIHSEMEPIPWLISPELVEIDDENIADLVGAITDGIEYWNDVFGYTVFEVAIADETDSWAEDRVNYFVMDSSPALGYAYADWRDNPMTGEIRGGSVYYSRAFINDVTRFTTPPPEEEEEEDDTSSWQEDLLSTEGTLLRWNNTDPTPSCRLTIPGPTHMDPKETLTQAEQIERYIAWVAAHEIGHVLGLRHNFKGSLEAPGSTVMEYASVFDIWEVEEDFIGAYDIEAIEYLYGISTELPVRPFCTDGDVASDPNCYRFDRGAAPLQDDHIPDLISYVDRLIEEVEPANAGTYGRPVAPVTTFVRAGSDTEAEAAWAALVNVVGVPVDADTLAKVPSWGTNVDALSGLVYEDLFLNSYGSIDIVPSGAVLGQITDEAVAIIANTDGVRSFENRRVVVDAMKAAQVLEGLQALEAASLELNVQLLIGGMSSDDQSLTRDLLARIEAAMTPYFD